MFEKKHSLGLYLKGSTTQKSGKYHTEDIGVSVRLMRFEGVWEGSGELNRVQVPSPGSITEGKDRGLVGSDRSKLCVCLILSLVQKTMKHLNSPKEGFHWKKAFVSFAS